MIFFIFIDHLKNLYLQLNAEDLGLEKSFKIWWHQFYFENISMNYLNMMYNCYKSYIFSPAFHLQSNNFPNSFKKAA